MNFKQTFIEAGSVENKKYQLTVNEPVEVAVLEHVGMSLNQFSQAINQYSAFWIMWIFAIILVSAMSICFF